MYLPNEDDEEEDADNEYDNDDDDEANGEGLAGSQSCRQAVCSQIQLQPSAVYAVQCSTVQPNVCSVNCVVCSRSKSCVSCSVH